MVDTLRADHLPLYGYPRDTLPGLSARAASAGVVFEDVRAQAPCTFPSVNSMLTSRSPGLFLARAGQGDLGIPDGMPTLATLLAGAGYMTAAVSASPIVRDTPSKENPSAGFGAGFEEFDEECRWREAACVSARARSILRHLEPPFFLYVHFMDPHDPYQLPSNARLERRFAGPGPEGEDRRFVRAGDPRPLEAHLYGGGADPRVSASDLAHWIDLYDDQILYLDREVTPLVEEIRKRTGDATTIALVSDHGEEFFEHGSIKHCHTLFDTELRVPMVLFVPGVAPRRISLPVSNLDLTPTLLELMGVPPPPELEGRALGRLMRAAAPSGAAVEPPPAASQFATFGSLWSIASGGFKLIADGADGSERFYDLTRDPRESSPLAATFDAEMSKRLRDDLAAWQRDNYRAGSEAGSRELEKQLKSVGYLQ